MHIWIILTGVVLIQFVSNGHTSFNRTEWMDYLERIVCYRIVTQDQQLEKGELFVTELFAYIGNIYYTVDTIRKNDVSRAGPMLDSLVFNYGYIVIPEIKDWGKATLKFEFSDEEMDYVVSIINHARYLWRILFYEMDRNGYAQTTSAEYYDTDELVTGFTYPA